MFDTVIYGFLLGIGLIVSLGPQNLFLIQQATYRNHHIFCALLCFIFDSILIAMSTLGVGDYLTHMPVIETCFLILGILFLGGYGGQNLWEGIKGLLSIARKKDMLWPEHTPKTMQKVALITVSFTFLNPHAWIDTLVIIGGASMRVPEAAIPYFAGGVISAGFVWFFALALLTAQFSETLRRPLPWVILRILSGSIMLSVCMSLVFSAL